MEGRLRERRRVKFDREEEDRVQEGAEDREGDEVENGEKDREGEGVENREGEEK